MPRRSWAFLFLLASCGGPDSNVESKDPYERYLGVRDLVDRWDAVAAKEALKFLEDPHYLVVVGALELLADVGYREFLQHAVPKLKHPHPMVRAQACDTIAAIENEDGISALVETLKDTNPGVRRAAVKALAAFGRRPEVRQVLVQTVGDKDPSVAYLAHETLQEITGHKDVERSQEAWAQVVR